MLYFENQKINQPAHGAMVTFPASTLQNCQSQPIFAQYDDQLYE